MKLEHIRRTNDRLKKIGTVSLVLLFAAVGLAQLPVSRVSAANGAIWPTGGAVTSRFGWRCLSNTSDDHKGYDIAAPQGTPVYATQDGTVTNDYHQVGYGKFVIVTHANGWSSRYAHLHTHDVVGNGGFVRQGDIVGYVGNTGVGSQGNHLHFEMMLNGVPQNFNHNSEPCAPYDNNAITAKAPIDFNFANLVSTTAQTQLANVNGCGALYIKRTYWGNWEQHMGCGQAKSVAMSPNGNLIAVVRPDNTLVAKETYWGNWVQHTGVGDTQDVAVGNNGFIANVNGCGALYIKRSWWGNWEQHMGCGQAKGVSMSGNGETILVTRPDNTLVGKSSYWGNWVAHTAVGDSQDSAVSSNGTIANVNSCGALYVKQSYWGNWVQHTGCGQAKAIAVSPNGEAFATVRPDDTLIAKQSYWGNWAQHVAVGDTKHAAVANP